jgi:lysophospholipase L1-like esterase
MPYDVKESPSWPVNELGEIVMQTGKGSSSIVGFIPSNQVPIDPDTRKVVMAGAAQIVTDANNNTVGIVGADGKKVTRLIPSMQQKPLLFIGDSLTMGASSRLPNISSHIPLWNTTNLVATAFGTNWVVQIILDGRIPNTSTGILETDGSSKLRWTLTGDSVGAWVDVSLGGFFTLSSGTSPYQLFVKMRNASASNTIAPVIAGAGAVTVSGGASSINNYDLLGFPAWVVGAVGDTFSDYVMCGISGDTSENLLSRLPQALSYSEYGAIVLLIGTNDNPSSIPQVTASVNRIKAIIDLCLAKNDRLYVGDIFPRGDNTVAARRYLALVSTQIRAYCQSKFGVRFWSGWDAMVDPTAMPTTLLTGVQQPDNLHLMPYGGYRASQELIRQIKYDFFVEQPRKSQIDSYDSSLLIGSWNLNPTLRGTAGSVTASRGITGTAPDNWTVDRGNGAGGTQTCTTTFEPVSDGTFWYALNVANAGASDYHTITQTFNIPAEITDGMFFRCFSELKIFNANLISTVELSMVTNIGTRAYALLLNKNLSTFSTEQPEIFIPSESFVKLAGMTSITLSLRFGGAAGSSGKIGVRSIRVEKV